MLTDVLAARAGTLLGRCDSRGRSKRRAEAQGHRGFRSDRIGSYGCRETAAPRVCSNLPFAERSAPSPLLERLLRAVPGTRRKPVIFLGQLREAFAVRLILRQLGIAAHLRCALAPVIGV